MHCLQADTCPSLAFYHADAGLLHCTVFMSDQTFGTIYVCISGCISVFVFVKSRISVHSALHSVDVRPNLCHYLWALCLIRLRRLQARLLATLLCFYSAMFACRVYNTNE